MPSHLQPGFITLHGNQLELLRATVFEWLRNHPLEPLEEEVFLVQSNGIAEWLKIALAQETGICAATQVTLPARFLWKTYRAMLGPDRVPRRSCFDKSPLTWRLMRLLPHYIGDPAFRPLRNFLIGGDSGSEEDLASDPERCLQLAQRLADLIDQYQVYRAQWLEDWAAGKDVVRHADGREEKIPDSQKWQPLLWRTLLNSVPQGQGKISRADIHRQFIDACIGGSAPAGEVPRRVVLFGISALPLQTMEALGALAQRVQVILAIPNPCRFYWGDIIDGRELLTAERRRQRQRRDGVGGVINLGNIGLEEMHQYSHPLLASWGKMGRDFIRLLDHFDDVDQTRRKFPNLRIDVFNEDGGETLLAQVQSAIRDLLPLSEHLFPPRMEQDRSIEFHIAHSAQREVEILHDQLLTMLGQEGIAGLQPRDVVVMVPDIAQFSPSINAVFGQYQHEDRRFIPFQIADIGQRHVNPMLTALDWLLRLPQQRCLQSEVRDLLDVPAVAARFGLSESDLPKLGQWIEAAGVRWGLDAAHRKHIGLEPAGEQNAWMFGIRRMLLGYASGRGGSFCGIEPFGEVGGLDAALAGSLACFVNALLDWRELLSAPVSPELWGLRARDLVRAFFKLLDENDRLTAACLEQSLQAWLDDCAVAGFDQSIPLEVFREAWLGSLDEPALQQRFMAGGVTFCTLLPMRAVPFRVVCLLGLNDGDYPRRAQHADFDLMAQAGLAWPGDRSRRNDDRYLMLEALLSARDKLYISWAGRNVRDNSEQPPSVLVSQLRDYLEAGWKLELKEITREHPLQPFSRRYFEPGSGLLTYANEWRSAHLPRRMQEQELPAWQMDPEFRLSLRNLAEFVEQPVTYFFKHRLHVEFHEQRLVGQDEEAFALDGLTRYQIVAALLEDGRRQADEEDVPAAMKKRADRLVREGVLPIGALGSQILDELVQELIPVRETWLRACRLYPHSSGRIPILIERDGLCLDDWLDKLCSNGEGRVWLELSYGRLLKDSHVRPEKLIPGWIRQLAAAAIGHEVSGYLVAPDAVIEMRPLAPAAAVQTLEMLMRCWKRGMDRPLATACRTIVEYLRSEASEKNRQSPGTSKREASEDEKRLKDEKALQVRLNNARRTYEGGDYGAYGEVKDPCLARMWPDFDALKRDLDWGISRELYQPLVEWLSEQITVYDVKLAFQNSQAIPGASAVKDAA